MKIADYLAVSFASTAAVVSWEANHSIGWAVLHSFLGGFYLLYHALV